MNSFVILLGAGLLAGAMNAVAGGGTFVTLPVLLWAGVPAVAANASSTVALFPGSLASTWAWRGELQPLEGVSARALGLTSAVGGLLGAVLLLLTPGGGLRLLLHERPEVTAEVRSWAQPREWGGYQILCPRRESKATTGSSIPRPRPSRRACQGGKGGAAGGT